MNKYDKMIACNRKASAEKIDLARRTIFEMVEEGEKVTIPKLIAKTGLSRGFFYKNPMVRQALDKALEQQVGMIDPGVRFWIWRWIMRSLPCTKGYGNCSRRISGCGQKMKRCRKH